MISVIGGAGFIGTSLCCRLARMQVPFEVLDLKISRVFPSQSKCADIRNFESLSAALTGKTIINLAAEHKHNLPDNAQYFETNLEGARVLADVAAARQVRRILQVSSVAVYGPSAHVQDEHSLPAPASPYGHSKLAAERVLRGWAAAAPAQRDLIISRPAAIFGAGGEGNINLLISRICAGHFVQVGCGSQVKSIAYVENYSDFLAQCALWPDVVPLHNFVDTPNWPVARLVAEIRRCTGRAGQGIILPRDLGEGIAKGLDLCAAPFGRELSVSSARLAKYLQPTEFESARPLLRSFPRPVSMAEGLRKTISTMRRAPRKRRGTASVCDVFSRLRPFLS